MRGKFAVDESGRCFAVSSSTSNLADLMRGYIFVFSLITCLALLASPADALIDSDTTTSQVEQVADGDVGRASSGALSFLTDVKRTIWEIPEPATLVLLGAGLATASRFIRRRRSL
jgi:hypothetical protein